MTKHRPIVTFALSAGLLVLATAAGCSSPQPYNGVQVSRSGNTLVAGDGLGTGIVNPHARESFAYGSRPSTPESVTPAVARPTRIVDVPVH
jgi:hypothetical protein